jgi:replicative DNA helicase
MENKFSNQQAESIILGSILMNNAYLRSVEFVETKHFYFAEHQAIWEKIIETISLGSVANQTTLLEFFQNNKQSGGIVGLGELLQEATGVVDIREYGKVIVELWQKRELENQLKTALDDLDNKSFSFISGNLENEMAGLAIQEPKKKTQHIAEIMAEVDQEQALGLGDKFTPTGFYKLDELLNGGIYNQQLCIIGARPSIGKSAIAQNIITSASKAGKKCLFVSLEMNKKSVYLRFLSDLASLETWKIQKNILNQSELSSLKRAKDELRTMEIFVNDSTYLKTSQIAAMIKTQLEKKPVDLVVVDYVQIVKGDEAKGKNESTMIKDITTALKGFAKTYDVGVLALAQINRKAVEGSKQEPTINDFKSSGGIEEDADVAIILHRDRDDERKEGYFSDAGKLIIAKNRHGRTGEVLIEFSGKFSRFTEIGGY